MTSRKAIDHLFADGVFIRQKGLSAVWQPAVFADGVVIKAAFSVPKRKFKRAVDRNLLKRRMREAWRFHKADFLPFLEENDKKLAILVKYNSRKIHTFNEIEKDMIRVFKKLKEKI